MPWTTVQVEAAIDTLQTALATGQRSVTVAFADRSHGITYSSVDEILRALAFFQGQLATLSGRPRQFVAVSSKGFDE
jgi:hypothetical protein